MYINKVLPTEHSPTTQRDPADIAQRQRHWDNVLEFCQSEHASSDVKLRRLADETARQKLFGRFAAAMAALSRLPTGDERQYFAANADKYDRLNERERDVVCLMLLEGYNGEDAAKLLGIKRSEASAALMTARAKLSGRMLDEPVNRTRFNAETADEDFLQGTLIDEKQWRQFVHLFPPVKAEKWGSGLRHVSDRVILSLVLRMLRENLNQYQVSDTVSYSAINNRLAAWQKAGLLPDIFRVLNQQSGAWNFHWTALPAPYRPMH